jgi:hypothetical protein
MVRSPPNADRQIYRSLYRPRTKYAVEGQHPRLTPEGEFVVQVVEGVEICHSVHIIDVLVVDNSLVVQPLLLVANNGVCHREEVWRKQAVIIKVLVF